MKGAINKNELWVPALLVLLAAAVRLLLFSGVYGHDDWAYLFYIRSYTNGQTHEILHSLWGLRFLIWFPVAVLFKVFGVSFSAAFAPGFILGLTAVPLTYFILRHLRMGIGVATLGCLFLILSPIDWQVSTTIRGDIEMSFYSGALLLALLGLRQAVGRNKYYWGLLAGVIWGFSVLSKEWGYVMAWGIFFVAAVDFIKTRRFPWEYTGVAAGFALILFMDAALLKYLTGDWLARVHTSIGFFQNLAGGGVNLDTSTSYRYLVDLFLGLRTVLTSPEDHALHTLNSWFGTFNETPLQVNHYPYFGPYMWMPLVSLPIVLFSRGPGRAIGCYILGIVLWIQFGSMSWQQYLPYHKEPRYFTIISVPAAVLVALACSRIFRAGVARHYKIVAAGVLGAMSIVMVQVATTNHLTYTSDRDYMPRLVSWLEENPTVRLWSRASIQNELDLRFGYRFSDPVHRHSGQSGYGSIMDAAFGNKAQEGDYVLLDIGSINPASELPALGSRRLKWEMLMAGKYSGAVLLRVQANRPEADGAYYLSDKMPITENHSFASVRRDASFDASPIVINGKRYRSGLGVHALSEIGYPVDPRYTVFTAAIGVEDSASNSPGSVVFTVYADNTVKYRSPVMRWGSPTINLELDLSGAGQIKLVMDDAGDGIAADHGAWAEAKMSPPKSKTP
jgi:hypothetical protein